MEASVPPITDSVFPTSPPSFWAIFSIALVVIILINSCILVFVWFWILRHFPWKTMKPSEIDQIDEEKAESNANSGQSNQPTPLVQDKDHRDPTENLLPGSQAEDPGFLQTVKVKTHVPSKPESGQDEKDATSQVLSINDVPGINLPEPSNPETISQQPVQPEVSSDGNGSMIRSSNNSIFQSKPEPEAVVSSGSQNSLNVLPEETPKSSQANKVSTKSTLANEGSPEVTQNAIQANEESPNLNKASDVAYPDQFLPPKKLQGIVNYDGKTFVTKSVDWSNESNDDKSYQLFSDWK